MGQLRPVHSLVFVIFEPFFGGTGIVLTKYTYVCLKEKIWKNIDKAIVYPYLPVLLHWKCIICIIKKWKVTMF